MEELLQRHGGEASVALRLEEREEISRGIAAGRSIRQIAQGLGRSPSTVSREIKRNGGCSAPVISTGRRNTLSWKEKMECTARDQLPAISQLRLLCRCETSTKSRPQSAEPQHRRARTAALQPAAAALRCAISTKVLLISTPITSSPRLASSTARNPGPGATSSTVAEVGTRAAIRAASAANSAMSLRVILSYQRQVQGSAQIFSCHG